MGLLRSSTLKRSDKPFPSPMKKYLLILVVCLAMTVQAQTQFASATLLFTDGHTAQGYVKVPITYELRIAFKENPDSLKKSIPSTQLERITFENGHPIVPLGYPEGSAGSTSSSKAR